MQHKLVTHGARFGRLIIESQTRTVRHNRVWLCLCDCGNRKEIIEYNLKSGHTKSCGCLSRDSTASRFTEHGKCATPEYWAWSNMIQRCTNPKNKRYKQYGARGITVCEPWRSSFTVFLRDIGQKPSPRHTLERINNDGNYEPSNCKWATYKEQSQNQRFRFLPLTFDNKPITVQEIADLAGIKYSAACARLRRGWTIDEVIRIPLGTKRSADASSTHTPGSRAGA